MLYEWGLKTGSIPEKQNCNILNIFTIDRLMLYHPSAKHCCKPHYVASIQPC